jgi:HK97 family phage portal protein
MIGFLTFTLRVRLKRIETGLERALLTPADRVRGVHIKFNVEGLLRADSAARARFYRESLASGWMTINEVREIEGLPPVPGGDVPRMQMQNQPITSVPTTEQE